MTILKVARHSTNRKEYFYFNIITKNMDISAYVDDAAEVYIYPDCHLDTSLKTVWVKDSNDFVICAVDDLLQL